VCTARREFIPELGKRLLETHRRDPDTDATSPTTLQGCRFLRAANCTPTS
jgi:hypothetical protein